MADELLRFEVTVVLEGDDVDTLVPRIDTDEEPMVALQVLAEGSRMIAERTQVALKNRGIYFKSGKKDSGLIIPEESRG